MLKGWTTFEKVWLGVFTAINIYLFFAWGDSLLGLTSSMAGMLCVVLAAKGRISTFYVGLIQASTYAYISYTYGLYGEAMLNGLFYFPMQFVGIYYWKRNQVRNSVRGEDVRRQQHLIERDAVLLQGIWIHEHLELLAAAADREDEIAGCVAERQARNRL